MGCVLASDTVFPPGLSGSFLYFPFPLGWIDAQADTASVPKKLQIFLAENLVVVKVTMYCLSLNLSIRVLKYKNCVICGMVLLGMKTSG